jgi:hypothetical protein
LLPWPGCRETPVTATHLLARKAAAASFIVVISTTSFTSLRLLNA